MTPEEFLHHVLPQQGLYCLAFKKTGMQHRTYDNIPALLAEAAIQDKNGAEVYFCISTLANATIWDEEKKQNRVRVGSNCLQTRSLILDVDIREGDKYFQVPRDAAQEISRLTKSMALTSPTIIHTGGGFHVYWTADNALTSEEFAVKSSHFKNMVLAEFPKLGADPTRIADRASLLRIPGLTNHKRSQPITVICPGNYFPIEKISNWTNHNGGTKLAKVNGHSHAVPKGTPVLNLFAKSAPVNLVNVIERCGQLKEMYDTGGANCNEPLWYAMLGVVKHGEDSIQTAHTLSRNHAGYSLFGTEAKLSQANGTNTGPTTCRYFDNQRPAICAQCQFRGKITSPIQLASHTIAATTKAVAQITFTPPWPYVRRPTGGIVVELGEAGEELKQDIVYDYDLYPLKKLKDESSNEWLVRYRYFQPVDGWKEEVAALSDFADQKSAHKVLMKGGVVPTYGQSKKAYNVGRYMIDSIRDLEKKQGASIMHNQSGWRNDDSAFIVGNRMYSPGGIVVEIETSGALKELATKKFQMAGTLQKWTDIFDTYAVPGLESYAFGALLAFASPLYRFTGYNGVVYNMVGESGSGKSTVLKVISSVWMKPEEQLLKKSDTIYSAEVILGAMHNLPVVYDEITNIEGKTLSDLCYNITQGRGRNRLNTDAKLKSNNASWSLILCSTSNASLADKLSQFKSDSSAEGMRVFEVRIDKNLVIDKGKADAAFRRLDKNYGIAGDIYAKYIVDNKDAVITQLEETITTIDADLGIQSPERFWSALLGCVMVGGEISKSLGLHKYDMERLYAWASQHINSMRGNVIEKSADPMSILGNFLASKYKNSVVFIQGAHKSTIMTHNRDVTQIRLEINAGSAMGYIEYKSLVDYCKENSVSMSWWAEKLKANGILVETSKQKRLTAGCDDLPSINVKCWVVDLKAQEFREDLKKLITKQDDTK